MASFDLTLSSNDNDAAGSIVPDNDSDRLTAFSIFYLYIWKV